MNAPQKLAATIHRLRRRVGREVVAAAQAGRRVPSLTKHLPVWVEALTPLLAPFAVRGGRQALGRIRNQMRKRGRKHVAHLGGGDGVRGRVNCPDVGVVVRPARLKAAEPFAFDFSLFNERINDAIKRMVFDFVQSTLDTAKQDVEDAYALLRDELAEGLAKGEVVNRLAKRVAGIFDDPNQAYLIARTEGHRAVLAGEVIAAKESGVVSLKEWLPSSDPCPKCKELAGKTVGLDEPFVVLPGGGIYATVFHPPLHPRCVCALTYRIREDLA